MANKNKKTAKKRGRGRPRKTNKRIDPPKKRKKKKKKRVAERSEYFTNSAKQPSVVVKILLFAAGFYFFCLAAYLIAKWYYFFSVPAEIYGIDSTRIMLAAQIFIVSFAAAIGTKLFLLNPLRKIRNAILDLTKGDYLVRANYNSRDEIGELASHFNKMITKLTEVNAEKMQTEYDLLMAKEDLKFKETLEKRESAVKEANRALEELVKELSLLYDIGQKVNSTIEMNELYRLLEELIPERFHLQKFAVLLLDEKKEFLSVRAANGFPDIEKMFELSFRVGDGVSGQAVKQGKMEYLPDVESDSRFVHYQGEGEEKGSFLSIPLRYKKDILGVMNCSRQNKSAFSDDDIRLLTLVANQIAMAVENAQLYTKTRELSVRDELTGLYNRRHFQQVLLMEWKRATRFRRPLSVLMIDIDHFKEFNDTFGHLNGDKVLKVIANLLVRNLREVDTLARFGGEEFIVLLPDTDVGGSYVVGEKLRKLVETERFDKEIRQLMPLTISVGISSFLSDAKEVDDLIDHADVALYEAKDRGRNRVVTYPSLMEIAETADERPSQLD